MAKAYFPCHECGADVLVIGNNRKDADRKAEWHESQEHICRDCELTHFAEQNAAAAVRNQEHGLPALSGSEKQRAWAETLRKDLLDRLDALAPIMDLIQSVEYARTASDNEREQVKASYLAMLDQHEGVFRTWLYQNSQEVMRAVLCVERFNALAAVLRRQSSACWWIDNRDVRLARVAEMLRDDIDTEVAARQPVSAEQREIIRDAQAEALLKPACEPVSPQIAEISLVGNELRVAFAEKREDFRLLMRGMGFRWAEHHWVRTLGFMQGDPIDRLAETAHRILALGCMARLHDEVARARAISGEFEPEQTRWITKTTGGAYDGWSRITWPKSDDLYTPAKRLLGARYKDGAVYVPPGSILEVADFAERYGFAVSPGVAEMRERHRQALAAGVVVADIKQTPEPVRDDGRRPELSAADSGIDDELKD